MSTAKKIPPTPAADPVVAGAGKPRLRGAAADGVLTDALGRPLHDLRISVTDRCNFRCTYCMPKEVFGRAYKFLDREEILSFEEITRLARIFVAHGVRKLRLTGGEPTLRRDLPTLVSMLREIDGLEDLTMTTNGSRLADLAPALRAAGLDRLTVSLDSLDDAVFRAMNDVDFPVSQVLEGIDAALAAGFRPVKINMVVKRGENDHTVVDFARRFKGPDYIVRFIEYMDVGASNGWDMADVVPAAEIVRMIGAEMPLEPADANYRGEVAQRWRYKPAAGRAVGRGPSPDGGEIGVIASVTQPFCGDCTRARLSADGRLYTCLFGVIGHDFRKLLRAGKSDEEIAAFLRRAWSGRKDRYSELRTKATPGKRERVEMSYIGG